MVKKKARRQPRKKASNRVQAMGQLARYSRLLDSSLAKLVAISKKIDAYRKKVNYYQYRVNELTARELADAAAAEARLHAERDQLLRDIENSHGRAPRAIDLGEH